MDKNKSETRPFEEYGNCDSHSMTYYLNSPVDGFYRYTHILLVILNILLSVVGTLANTLVITAYKKNNHLRTSSNLLIAVLAMNDLVLTAFVQPLQVTKTLKEIFGTHNCVFLGVFVAVGGFCMMISLLTITILSIERCITLAYPYHHQNIVTPSRLRSSVVLSWFLQLLLIVSTFTPLPDIVFTSIQVTIITFSVSTVVAIWIWIHRLIRRHKFSIDNLQVPSCLSNEKTFRTTKTSRLIVTAVLSCYSPFAVGIVCYSIEPNNFFLLFLILPLAATGVFVNSTLNPLILFWRKRTFRETARKLLAQNLTTDK